MNKMERDYSLQSSGYKSGELNSKKSVIKSVRERLISIQLQLNKNAKTNSLYFTDLNKLKEEILEIKKKYWMDLHWQTKKTIIRKIDIIDKALEKLIDPSKISNKAKSNKIEKTYRTSTKSIDLRKSNIPLKKSSKTISLKKSIGIKRETPSMSSRMTASPELFNKIENNEQLPDNSFSEPNRNERLLESLVRNFDINNVAIKDEDIMSNVNFEELNFELDKPTCFCLTEAHCKTIAQLLRINEKSFIDIVRSVICGNDDALVYEDISVIGPSESPMSHRTWRLTKATRKRKFSY